MCKNVYYQRERRLKTNRKQKEYLSKDGEKNQLTPARVLIK